MARSLLDGLDIKLLQLFVTLLDEGSVTLTAEKLRLTPSAVSHALRRLRLALDDELFVRTPSGMMPTPRSLQIGARLRASLADLEAALQPERFSPGETRRQFAVSCLPYFSWAVMSPIATEFVRLAPYANLRIHPGTGNLAEQLASRQIDLAVGCFRSVPDAYEAAPLYTDRMMWAVKANHHAFGQSPTVEHLAALDHVVVNARANATAPYVPTGIPAGLEHVVIQDDGGALQHALEAIGAQRRVPLTVPDTHTALSIVSNTAMAALVPYTLARFFAPIYGVDLFELPYAAPGLDVTVLWSRQFGEEEPVRWLRALFPVVTPQMQ